MLYRCIKTLHVADIRGNKDAAPSVLEGKTYEFNTVKYPEDNIDIYCINEKGFEHHWFSKGSEFKEYFTILEEKPDVINVLDLI